MGQNRENPNFNTFGTNGVFAFKIPTELNNYNVKSDKDKLVSTYFVFYVVFFFKQGLGLYFKEEEIVQVVDEKKFEVNFFRQSLNSDQTKVQNINLIT